MILFTIRNLYDRKNQILIGVILFTLAGYYYVSNIVPSYKVSSSINAPTIQNVSQLNRVKKLEYSSNKVFSSFLNIISSKEFQNEVFEKGNYIKLFNPDGELIDDLNIFIYGALHSISIERPEINRSSVELGFLNSLPYKISMEGQYPKAITDYINDLIISANNKTLSILNNQLQNELDIQIDELVSKRIKLFELAEENRNSLIDKLKLEWELKKQGLYSEIEQEKFITIEKIHLEINRLKDSADLAKSLGVFESNLDYIIKSSTSDSGFIPEWYLLGEKGLREKIKLLENTLNEQISSPKIIDLKSELKLTKENRYLNNLILFSEIDSYEKEISELEIEINELNFLKNTNISLEKSFDLFSLAVKPIRKKDHKSFILFLFSFTGFLFSIFLILLVSAFKKEPSVT